MDETITIKNGKRIKEWIIFVCWLGGILIAGAVCWTTTQNRISNIEIEQCRVERTGTAISVQNKSDIIRIKADVEWTRAGVARIENKLEQVIKK